MPKTCENRAVSVKPGRYVRNGSPLMMTKFSVDTIRHGGALNIITGPFFFHTVVKQPGNLEPGAEISDTDFSRNPSLNLQEEMRSDKMAMRLIIFTHFYHGVFPSSDTIHPDCTVAGASPQKYQWS